MEHRWGHRKSIDVAVEIVTTSGRAGVGRMTNISSSGVYVATGMRLRPYSVVYLTPMHPGRGNAGAHAAACVVRSAADGIGLEWCDEHAGTFDVQQLFAVGAEAVARLSPAELQN